LARNLKKFADKNAREKKGSGNPSRKKKFQEVKIRGGGTEKRNITKGARTAKEHGVPRVQHSTKCTWVLEVRKKNGQKKKTGARTIGKKGSQRNSTGGGAVRPIRTAEKKKKKGESGGTKRKKGHGP